MKVRKLLWFLRPNFKKHSKKIFVLNLCPGEIVEVHSEDEIFATLDENGTLEGLPFIPEMRKYCGKRYKVLKRVNKLIVEIEGVGMRRMKNTVILEGVTCDGKAHGGCRRTCLLLWKEAWLKRARNDLRANQLLKDVLITTNSTSLPDEIFSCQSTNLIKATSPLHIWDISQYIWDIRCGTFKPLERMHMWLIWLSLEIKMFLGGGKHITISGKCKRTPTVALNLLPGELVEVKSKEEILATLDTRGRNRGLGFTPEMLKYCGKRYRVLKRLDKMINEQTGAMRQIANTVFLEGVTCDGKAHGSCPRACYCLWREIWLKRVE